MAEIAWLVKMTMGGTMRTGEIDRISEALTAAAQAAEPHSTVTVTEFYNTGPPADAG